MNAITRDDYEKIVRHSGDTPTRSLSDNEVKLELTKEMKHCFEEYCPRQWTQDASYHAIAAILLHFELEEDGELSTVAGRIRKRFDPKRLDRKHHQRAPED